ncbi:MAG: HEAT repeat domain-containing protein [Candidatus Riflebacteria bacterium]|nr:HEAT repeat domain-containing protein [Candidatus Riflebacteria bacterium]
MKRLPFVLLLGAILALAFHATLSALALRYCPPLERLALRHLASLGERALPYILDFLGADDPRVRKLGESLLEAVKNGADWTNVDPRVVADLVRQFERETDPIVRRHLATVLGSSSSKEAVDALSSGLKDPAIRGACANALTQIAGHAPDPSLAQAAKQASELASSAEAGRLVSTTVDTVRRVAGPLASSVDTLLATTSRPPSAPATPARTRP